MTSRSRFFVHFRNGHCECPVAAISAEAGESRKSRSGEPVYCDTFTFTLAFFAIPSQGSGFIRRPWYGCSPQFLSLQFFGVACWLAEWVNILAPQGPDALLEKGIREGSLPRERLYLISVLTRYGGQPWKAILYRRFAINACTGRLVAVRLPVPYLFPMLLMRANWQQQWKTESWKSVFPGCSRQLTFSIVFQTPSWCVSRIMLRSLSGRALLQSVESVALVLHWCINN